jgi:hypothetical protein
VVSVLNFTNYIFGNFYSTYIPKENHIIFTPYIFLDNQKSSLHFECLARQEMVLECAPGYP